MEIYWLYGDAWVDLREILVARPAVLVSQRGALQLVSPGTRSQMNEPGQLPDTKDIPWDRLSSSGPCGVTFWDGDVFHAGSPIVLACSPPAANAVDGLKDLVSKATRRLGQEGRWTVTGHPDESCGALHCPRSGYSCHG